MARPLLILVLTACLCLAGCGITAPDGNAGFADVQTLDWRHTDQRVSLSIGPGLLSLAARFVEDDPHARQILRNLQGVRVKVYEVEPGEADAVSLGLEDMRQSLVKQSWEPVVVVRENTETTYMLVKMDGEEIQGIVVLNSDGTEAVIVNIMGDLQPEMFARTVAALDIPIPEVELSGHQPD
ncbi:DUF4252 domain-containing protein [Seongchinamella unica]|uniref:DUF4252 domain-containing protein n=1 Tax=Seongchinamella unica TaxID=2547392 RepID=A0A4R5LWS3_9GAMM|nr:DUF4252 domain-containing protein [Seongchinamella unica]TDG15936.1 DUF4252 domain-containing protein [Seongchinamella unica]